MVETEVLVTALSPEAEVQEGLQELLLRLAQVLPVPTARMALSSRTSDREAVEGLVE
jgi:hypothetical protein